MAVLESRHPEPASAGHLDPGREYWGGSWIARTPSSLETVVLTSSGTESVEAAIKLAQGGHACRPPRLVYCERGFHGLTLGSLSVNGNEEFRERFLAAAPRMRQRALRRRLDAAGRELRRVTWRSSSNRIQGKGCMWPPTATSEAAQEALPGNRDPAAGRRGPDWPGPDGPVPGPGSLGDRARPRHAVQGAPQVVTSPWAPSWPPRKVFQELFDYDGAKRGPRLDLRRG